MTGKSCSFCKERPTYAKNLCQRCYNRASTRKRLTGKFDPAPAEHLPKRSGPIVCASCGRKRKHCARGLCATCWRRGNARERAGKGFAPEKLPPQGSIPRMALSDTTYGVLRFLAATPELNHRRFKRFGADLGRELGVSREYIRQVLVKLQRQGWINYHLGLSAEAQAVLDVLEAERKGQLRFNWAWAAPS